MKRLLSLISSMIVLLLLAGCAKYSSSYNAVGFAHSNSSASAVMSFHSFDGTIVFKLKSHGEGDLKYAAKLESGNVTVYYDYNGTKSELFSIGSGEKMDSHGGYVESGTVYVIVETGGECLNGEFSFSIE